MSRGDSGYMSHHGSIYSSKSDDTLDDWNSYDFLSPMQPSLSEKRDEFDDHGFPDNQAHHLPKDYNNSADYKPTTPKYPFLQQEPTFHDNNNGHGPPPQSNRKFDTPPVPQLKKYPSNTLLNRTAQTNNASTPQRIPSPQQTPPPSHSPRLHPAHLPNNYSYTNSASHSPRLSPSLSQYNGHSPIAHSPRLSPASPQSNNGSYVNLTSHSPRLSPVHPQNHFMQGNSFNSHQYYPNQNQDKSLNGPPVPQIDPISQVRNHKSLPANPNKTNKIIPIRSNTHDGQLKLPVPLELPKINDNFETSDFTEIHDFIDHYCDSDDKSTETMSKVKINANNPDQSPEDPAVKNRKREAAVSEIITTERTYVDGLRKLVNVFLLPLQENFKLNQKSSLLSSKTTTSTEEINSIFSNIVPLLSLHEQLLKSLEERMSKWSSTEIISDVFLRIAPFLKMYTTYLQSFPHAINLLERLNKENKDFKKFLQSCQARPELGNLPFNSFLSLPIQRIPRYKLLLDALIKHTDESHPDYENLQKCFRQITEIADEVNEKIRDVENQQKVLEIQYKIEGLAGNIVNPARRFLHEGILYKVTPQILQAKPLFIATQEIRIHFLFNDLLMFCSEFQGKLRFKGHIDLNRASVVDIADDAADKPFCFQIVTMSPAGEARHTVRAKTAKEKAEWLDKLRCALSGLKNVIRGHKNVDPRTGPLQKNVRSPVVSSPNSNQHLTPPTDVSYKQASSRAADDLFIGSNRSNQRRQLRPQVSHGNLNLK